MASEKIKVWSFEWDDAGGPGMKLFASEEEFHAFLFNQASTSDSKLVQRLLAQNKTEQAYLVWRNENDEEPFYKYNWSTHEVEPPNVKSSQGVAAQ